MVSGLEILSELVVHSKYAKYLPQEKRRETWQEITNRYSEMMIKKYPQIKGDIIDGMSSILNKKILPSMRALQFAGAAAERNNARVYNCAYLPVEDTVAFKETMFLLLGGTGVGYSVQKQHVAKLPRITVPTVTQKYVVQDSIIGWADAVDALINAYFHGAPLPRFDYSDVRDKGARLITAGGKAPGPGPLKEALEAIAAILAKKANRSRLTPFEAHRIQCFIANSVLAGGIRRAALIALFSHDDDEMLLCKSGNWWETHEELGRANNSVALLRGKIKKKHFNAIWRKVRDSNAGEPGIYWTNNLDWGTNPCCEIALRPYQFCNLCEINADNITSQEDLNQRAAEAAMFGTLQAGFTDFHYLRPIWQQTTEKDGLLGIGITGIGSGKILQYDLAYAADIATASNSYYAQEIGINPAARVTCIKPSGTTSCVLECSSGIHAWYDKYFLRTIRLNKSEDLALYLIVNHPELVEDDVLRPHDTICVRIPVMAPEGSILRHESALETLERVKKFSEEWVKPGHHNGDNTHNVSTTIYLKDNEWDSIGEWMWENRNVYNGISVLPYDGGTYKQTPFETISKEEYERRYAELTPIDLLKIIELDDNVNFGQTEACAGGNCNI